MKFSFLSALYCRYPLEKVFESASELGFDGVEIWGARPHAYAYDMDQRKVEEILSLKEKFNIEIPLFCAELLAYPYNISSTDEKERRDTIDYLKHGIDAAAAIGAPRIQMACGHAGYGTSRKENMNNVCAVISALAEHAEKKEVDIIIEPLTVMESNTIVFLDDVLELFDRVGSPRVKSMLDTVMPMTNWETYSEYFEKLGDKLDYVHLEDSNGSNQYHQPMGTGILDFEEIARILKKYKYDGWISLELISSYIREPEMFLGKEIRSLKKYFGD